MKPREPFFHAIVYLPLAFFVVAVSGTCSAQEHHRKFVPTNRDNYWTDAFDIEKCQFAASGQNKYFILRPQYQSVFEGIEGSDTTRLVVTVLNETKKIREIETRIVEERESVNRDIIEVSRNYYAICTNTNTVFYFGEDVDIFKDGKLVSHSGSWRADSGGARAGVMMPGIILLGSRYYQEMAPKIAMDRVEIVSTTDTVETPAGWLTPCLKTEETTPLEPKTKEYKFYAPGIGLVKDGDLLLVKFGYQ